ncbi:MAG: hypothetical protein EHM70_17065 [Chloroflexota bacterium]|nr:MAG: hypothetical protein EHM70_17065 [Chloroflexota bacterium]
MSNSSPKHFGEWLRYYRLRCIDPKKGGKLTQQGLGELLGTELGIEGYTGAAVSDWERGESQINKDNRPVLASLIKVLHDNGGLKTPAEADKFLLSGKYSPLDEIEKLLIFPDAPPGLPSRPSIERLPISSLITQKISILNQDIKSLVIESGEKRHWTDVLLRLLGKFFERWTAEKVIQLLLWVTVWLLTWGLTFPILDWPFDNREQAWKATVFYITGTLTSPALTAMLTQTRRSKYWQAQNLANTLILRFYTYLGAYTGFHSGYVMVLAGALLGYFLRLGPLHHLIVGIVAAWPVLISYAAARQVPYNQLRAYGRLRFKDGAIFMVSALAGVLWGGLIYTYYPWILSPRIGYILVLIVIGLTAVSFIIQNRRKRIHNTSH